MSDAPLLLCTDLDRTLIPNGAEPESSDARPLFSRLASQPEVVVVFVTGRDRERVKEAIAHYSLPEPDLVVADVGTTIYDLRSGRWEPLERWERRIGDAWAGHSHAELADVVGDIAELALQDLSRQGSRKLSFVAPLAADVPTLDREVERRLEPLSVCAERIWSVDEIAGERLLDIVPCGATKLHAVEFLIELLGVPTSHTVFAGDSGNDLAALASAIPAVVVANARSEVIARARRLAAERGHGDHLYVARGGWAGMNGNYAAGILEGVVHYHPCWAETLFSAGLDRKPGSAH